jgi:carboxymethylenebutenolidase
MTGDADLGAVFDEHVAAEFEGQDVDATMRTMTDEPYVWHVPALTGASGGNAVRRFYSAEFIGQTPADTTLRPIARTVTAERVIDEFVLEFTHDREIPFMLPGLAATGRKVRIPTVVVMGFEDGKVAYEHIYWDQASVLVQIGLLDPPHFPSRALNRPSAYSSTRSLRPPEDRIERRRARGSEEPQALPRTAHERAVSVNAPFGAPSARKHLSRSALR